MPWFNNIFRHDRHQPGNGRSDGGGDEKPRPFPTFSTFLGMAAVLLVLWLLASGLPHLLPKAEQPAPSNITDTGAVK
ncbi:MULTISPECIES: hypothetical protein [unclassified Mesorhizobium]|uniref:hypothetical protein n=1 Tax=unclassified Mesorhizobium TaxID=325217 RepID=UPI000BB0230B|nr:MULTISPECIES: hypothetical protein [unclassified Mesorhizobium]TGT63396.1 hypothetical protein EN813_008320 [Mesorhizobium sp. M00.F.Ca.ET.170.01.1.1]AZO11514.1 hypothetical protein EJ074_22255 [Mesorhizobium sp. M3A.F.Ca.ET.080.04.2.1]PBB88223.1 hypothetical protein CK216_00250 [Mesorhizobium sp. WSM3876]RWB67309.1 MAG: hypothetical protein EOQ49_26190 [Mesorhizobium sp.]RWB91985.1 MAG: hypothetical protein EOQ52_00260 [Mesorhizobium sp.]